MKSLTMGMMGAGVAMMLLLPAASYADQQKTGDQSSFQNNVKALPSTHKRKQIIRSESGIHNGGHSTTGMGPSR